MIKRGIEQRLAWRSLKLPTDPDGLAKDGRRKHRFLPTKVNAFDGIFDLQTADLLHVFQRRGLKGIIRKGQCEDMRDGAKDWISDSSEKKNHPRRVTHQISHCEKTTGTIEKLTVWDDCRLLCDEPTSHPWPRLDVCPRHEPRIYEHLHSKALCFFFHVLFRDFLLENRSCPDCPTDLGPTSLRSASSFPSELPTRRRTHQVLRLCRRKGDRRLGLVIVAFHSGTRKYPSPNDE